MIIMRSAAIVTLNANTLGNDYDNETGDQTIFRWSAQEQTLRAT